MRWIAGNEALSASSSRTVMSKRFTPSSNVVTGSPPMPFFTTVSTSSAFKAVTGQRIAIHLDADLRFADVRLQREIGHAGHTGQHVLDAATEPIELTQIIAIDLQSPT
jgi:hypothetical protein